MAKRGGMGLTVVFVALCFIGFEHTSKPTSMKHAISVVTKNPDMATSPLYATLTNGPPSWISASDKQTRGYLTFTWGKTPLRGIAVTGNPYRVVFLAARAIASATGPQKTLAGHSGTGSCCPC